MISLELFKKIIKDIQDQELKDEQLTKLLVCPECTGWISTCEPIIDDLIQLLQFELGDNYETFEWYLYDISDGHKFVYEDINNNEQIKYNLNELDSLYYYITGELKKVPQEVVKKKINKYTETIQTGEETLEYIKSQIVGEH